MLIETNRLTLTNFRDSDSSTIVRLAGDYAVAGQTSNVPHPYTEDIAVEWIRVLNGEIKNTSQLTLGIRRSEDDVLIGCISLININEIHSKAEVGYWLGKDYWGMGYCSEALNALIRYAFINLNLNRIEGRCMSKNERSAATMMRCEMLFEGKRREDSRVRGELQDFSYYGILKRDLGLQ